MSDIIEKKYQFIFDQIFQNSINAALPETPNFPFIIKMSTNRRRLALN